MTSRANSTAALIKALDSAFLKALADPARQKIICVLSQGDGADVTTISGYLTQERSVVSRHLKVLHEAGIVTSRKDGRHMIYCLNGHNIIGHIEALLRQLKAVVGSCCP